MSDVRQGLFDIFKEIIDGEWGPYEDDYYWKRVDDALARLQLSNVAEKGAESMNETQQVCRYCGARLARTN